MTSTIMRLCCLVLLSGGVSTVNVSFAESDWESTNRSLVDYLEQALSTNPQLHAVEQRYRASAQRIPQASALPDPTLQVTHFVESIQTRNGPQESTFMLSQRLPWFGKREYQRSAAFADAQALHHLYQDQQLLLVQRVSQAFYEYAYLGKAIGLTRENRDLLMKLEPVVEAKVQGGAAINELLRLKVEIGKMEDRLQSLRQERITRSAQLAELLTLEMRSLISWPEWQAPSPLQVNRDDLQAAVRANHPRLKAMELRIQSADARRERARLERYPDVSVGLNYARIGDPSVSPVPASAGKDAWGVSLSLNLPIWTEKNNAAEAEALAVQRSSENERIQQENALITLLNTTLAKLENAQRQLILYGDELLGLAEQAAENSRAAYEGGIMGILEVIDSERSLLEFQLYYWRAAADVWQHRVMLQTLANEPILGTFDATHQHE